MNERSQRRLGDILVAQGTLSQDELAIALAEQQRTGQLLGELVVALGLASSSAVAAALADKHGWSNAHDVTGSDGTTTATAPFEPPPARPQTEELSQLRPPSGSEDPMAAAVGDPSWPQLLPPISARAETHSPLPRSDESAPESTDNESRASVLQTPDIPRSQSETSDQLVDLPGEPQSARLGDLLQTRDAELAEARARAAVQAAEIERLRQALSDQTAAAESSLAELATARATSTRLEREVAGARDALQAQATEANAARERSAAELEAVRTDLASAETELAAALEVLEARAIELETLRQELQQQQSRDRTAEEFDADRHLLFLPTADGYRLVERSGPAPEPGSRVDVGGGLGGRGGYLVLKTIRAPLPATRLLCAYLQPL